MAGLGVKKSAYDTQAYNHCTPVNALVALNHLVDTLEMLRGWMQSNRMKLNPDKTQYIWIGSKFQLSMQDRLPASIVVISGSAVPAVGTKSWRHSRSASRHVRTRWKPVQLMHTPGSSHTHSRVFHI